MDEILVKCLRVLVELENNSKQLEFDQSGEIEIFHTSTLNTK